MDFLIGMRRVRVAAACLFAALLLAGVSMAVYLSYNFHRFTPMLGLGWVFESGPYANFTLETAPKGVSVPAHRSTNGWGMRGDEPPRNWEDWNTVIAIGSSTTLCANLDDRHAWPFRLQEKLAARFLRTWIGNAGQDGVTAKSAATMMDQVIRKLRPKTVLWLAGGSDLALCFSDSRREGGSPYDKAFDNRLRLAMQPKSAKETFSLYRECLLWKRRQAGKRTIGIQASHKNFFPPKLESPEDPLPPDSLLLASLPQFRDQVLRVHALALEMGVRIVFITQPLAYGTGPEWAAREARTVEFHRREYRISAATERRLQDRFNSALLSLCVADKMECLDLAAQIPPDTTSFYDQGHFNDAGADRAAEKIAQYLLSYPSPPTPPHSPGS